MHLGTAANVAATNGYVLAFRIGAVLTFVCGVMVLFLLGNVSAQPRSPLAEMEVGAETS
jgi:hypothetical protein